MRIEVNPRNLVVALMLLFLAIGIAIIGLHLAIQRYIGQSVDTSLEIPDSGISIEVSSPKYLGDSGEDHFFIGLQYDEGVLTSSESISVTLHNNTARSLIPTEFMLAPETARLGYKLDTSGGIEIIFNTTVDWTGVCNAYSTCTFSYGPLRMPPFFQSFIIAPGPLNSQDQTLIVTANASGTQSQQTEEIVTVFRSIPVWLSWLERYVGYLANPELIPGVAAVMVALAALFWEQRERLQERQKQVQQAIETILDRLNEVERNLDRALDERQSLLDVLRDWANIGLHPEDKEIPESVHSKNSKLWTMASQTKSLHRFLEELGTEIRYADQVQTDELQTDLVRFVQLPNRDGNRALQEICNQVGQLLASVRQINELGRADDILSQIESLWSGYDEAARDICIYCLKQLVDTKTTHTHAALIRTLRDSPHMRRLIRDPRLELDPEIAEYATPMRIPWHPPYPALTLSFLSREDQWLTNNKFTRNPFGPVYCENDGLVFEISHLPGQLVAHMVQPTNACYTSESAQERTLAALSLMDLLDNADAFPIWSPIDWQGDSNPIRWIAHRLAEAWLNLLSRNPSVFFEMQIDEMRSKLVELLIWHLGSVQRVAVRLRALALENAGLSRPSYHNFNEDQIADRLRAARSLTERLLTARTIATSPAEIGTDDLHYWLSVRPMKWNAEQTRLNMITHTYLVATVGVSDTNSPDSHLLESLLSYVDTLRAYGLVMKIFLTPQEVHMLQPNCITSTTYNLRWDPDELDTILRRRLSTASSGFVLEFDDLFDNEQMDDFHTNLLELADGSLGRLLDLGRRTIVHHASQDVFTKLGIHDWDYVSS